MPECNSNSSVHSDKPAETGAINRLSDLVSRGFGMSSEAARLMVLQILGGIAGGTVTIQSPNGVVCTPAFDLAVIGGLRALLHGAQVALLDPVLTEFEATMDRGASQGGEHAGLQLTALITKHTELKSRIRTLEADLETLKKPPSHETMSAAGYMDRRNHPRPAHQRNLMEASLKSLRGESLAVEQRIVDWKFAGGAVIVRDEGGWAEFPQASRDSFDGHFLQLGSAANGTKIRPF